MSGRFALFRRAVRSRATRAAIAVVGVATSTLLVLVLLAGQRAVTSGVASYAGQADIDLWVAPKGTDNLIRSSALIPIMVAHALDQQEGIAKSGPLIRGFVSATAVGSDARPITLLAMGYRGPDGLGGPVKLSQGRRPASHEEAALDRAAAYRLGVTIGDQLSLNDKQVRIVGLTTGTDLVATQFVFLDGRQAEEASGFQGKVSFIAIQAEPGTDVAALARTIEARFSQVVVHTRADFVANNLKEVSAGFGGVLLLMSTVGVISASLLVALLVQGAVDDRRRDIAVLLAMGASLVDVSVGVVAHVVGIVVGGALLGALASAGLGMALVNNLPTVHLQPAWGDLLLVLGVFGGAGFLAAAVPLWRLRRIDPVEAFRP